MKVILAGLNLDCEALQECADDWKSWWKQLPDNQNSLPVQWQQWLKQGESLIAGTAQWQDHLTPESISAAYARISREDRSIDCLRRNARKHVASARASNRTIVFDMGHASIAEHAVLNLDLIGISRLLVEEVEARRLCSFTEKSQRYIHLDAGFVIPQEITNDQLRQRFHQQIRALYDYYLQLHHLIQTCQKEKCRNTGHQTRRKCRQIALEDARYILPMAVKTQLGMTINARNVEHLLRRLRTLNSCEASSLADAIYTEANRVIPSLVRYFEPSPYDYACRPTIISPSDPTPGSRDQSPVCLLSVTPNADRELLAWSRYASAKISIAAINEEIQQLSGKEVNICFNNFWNSLGPHDAVARACERITLTFELIVSASCYAQLKRHRMLTIIPQVYEPCLGVTIPHTISDVKEEQTFQKHITAVEKLYRELLSESPAAACYLLTNAHRRRVLLHVNLRSLYHLTRLRMDKHAQWEIRAITETMTKLAVREMPNCLAKIGGKDQF